MRLLNIKNNIEYCSRTKSESKYISAFMRSKQDKKTLFKNKDHADYTTGIFDLGKEIMIEIYDNGQLKYTKL